MKFIKNDKIRKALDRIWLIIKWFLLILFALIILCLSPIIFILTLIGRFFKRKVGEALDKLAVDFENAAISLDILGNVTIFKWTSYWWSKPDDEFHFGNRIETVSMVLKKKKQKGTLRKGSIILYHIINFFDKGHFDKIKV